MDDNGTFARDVKLSMQENDEDSVVLSYDDLRSGLGLTRIKAARADAVQLALENQRMFVYPPIRSRPEGCFRVYLIGGTMWRLAQAILNPTEAGTTLDEEKAALTTPPK